MENNGRIRGFLSDLEYAKAVSNESASSDPKTVCFDIKDTCCLTFDQGTPYFMPLEIHSGRRYARSHITALPQSLEGRIQYKKHLDNPHRRSLPRLIVRYKYNHDQESLMWVALYIVFGLVDWKAAQEIWPRIFTNTLYPSPDREKFVMDEESPLHPPFDAAFHDQLTLINFPASFELIRKSLWEICEKSEPKDENYYILFNTLIFAFDELLAVVDGKPDIVPFVNRFGQANIGTSQSATTKRKKEDIDIMRVRTALPIKRARSSTSKAEGKTAGKTAGKSTGKTAGKAKAKKR